MHRSISAWKLAQMSSGDQMGINVVHSLDSKCLVVSLCGFILEQLEDSIPEYFAYSYPPLYGYTIREASVDKQLGVERNS